jgi:hypothetical protein
MKWSIWCPSYTAKLSPHIKVMLRNIDVTVPTPDKWIWDETDFDSMSWHDNRVHAIAFDSDTYEFALDLDFITKWCDPPEGQNHFTFFVAPASMMFENPSNIAIDLTIGNIYVLFISEISRTYLRRTPNDKYNVWKYDIEFHHTGHISLEATGFKLYLRTSPMQTSSQHLSAEQRGGVSFNRERIAT